MDNIKQAALSKSRSYIACLSEANKMLFNNIRTIFARTWIYCAVLAVVSAIYLSLYLHAMLFGYNTYVPCKRSPNEMEHYKKFQTNVMLHLFQCHNRTNLHRHSLCHYLPRTTCRHHSACKYIRNIRYSIINHNAINAPLRLRSNAIHD